MARRFILFLALVFAFADVRGQSFENIPGLVSQREGDSLRLKIIPEDYQAWQIFRTEGIRLERASLADSLNFTFLATLEPPSEKDLRAADQTFGDIAADQLYPEPAPAPQSLADKLDDQSKRQMQPFFYYFATAQSRTLSRLSGLEFTMPLPEEAIRLRVKFGKQAAREQLILPRRIAEDPPAPSLQGDGGEKSAVLVWQHLAASDHFFAYDLERASRESGPYQKINASPLVYNQAQDSTGAGNMLYVDSLQRNYQAYYYRLVGYDYFGGRSLPSAPLRLMGRDRTPPAPVQNITLDHQGDNLLSIAWDPVEDPSLQGYFVLYSSETVNGPFVALHEQVLGPGVNSFQWAEFAPAEKNFFSVLSLDTAGNYRTAPGQFLFMIDSIPPALPDSMGGFIDSSGLVHLHWTPSRSGDIEAYRLFRTVNPAYEFLPVSDRPIYDTSFVDTVDMTMLDRHYFYRLVALDRNFNHSDYSPALHLRKPDIIPPTAPILQRPQRRGDTLTLRWTPSSSLDLRHYLLVVEAPEYIDSILVGQENGFQLRLPEPGRYRMHLHAVDSSGLYSPKSNLREMRIAASAAPEQLDFSLEYQPEEGVLLLELADKQPLRCLIYRAQGTEAPLRMLASHHFGERPFRDEDLNAGQVYRYALLLLTDDGRKLPLGAEKTFAVPER